jgi:hypothetical protein
MPGKQQSPLSSAILDAVAILDRGSESVRAVLAREENRFSRALADLKKLSEKEELPIAIVGGLGAIYYGYPAATQDIDISVGRKHLDALLEAAPKYGFKVAWKSKIGWHTLTHGDVEINVVPEGGKARASAPTKIPGPVKLGVAEGLDYANLAGWLELKLSSARQKDRAHIVEVMKKIDTSTLKAARKRLAKVHRAYVELFDELWAEARAENEQERRE